ncbi:uncharacterized protein Z518_04747 [Rhinocladiella mackenziei CBS 650.93]|uniref:Uncharacterized protein n=1 Tax=Rhinocladiella mackenziei CBS 650.93 TaxID=1442369 RepID=A0A0D2IUD4_9EURO|nr:uncharacterized protein Z518_04747 [Rhinocladiella mackenziei CBS 650.93]KIX06771.1 hypothetical protein Z518_04747 [Rhinocladiella mackenziei CBS 650.93]
MQLKAFYLMNVPTLSVGLRNESKSYLAGKRRKIQLARRYRAATNDTFHLGFCSLPLHAFKPRGRPFCPGGEADVKSLQAECCLSQDLVNQAPQSSQVSSPDFMSLKATSVLFKPSTAIAFSSAIAKCIGLRLNQRRGPVGKYSISLQDPRSGKMHDGLSNTSNLMRMTALLVVSSAARRGIPLIAGKTHEFAVLPNAEISKMLDLTLITASVHNSLSQEYNVEHCCGLGYIHAQVAAGHDLTGFEKFVNQIEQAFAQFQGQVSEKLNTLPAKLQAIIKYTKFVQSEKAFFREKPILTNGISAMSVKMLRVQWLEYYSKLTALNSYLKAGGGVRGPPGERLFQSRKRASQAKGVAEGKAIMNKDADQRARRVIEMPTREMFRIAWV